MMYGETERRLDGSLLLQFKNTIIRPILYLGAALSPWIFQVKTWTSVVHGRVFWICERQDDIHEMVVVLLTIHFYYFASNKMTSS